MPDLYTDNHAVGDITWAIHAETDSIIIIDDYDEVPIIRVWIVGVDAGNPHSGVPSGCPGGLLPRGRRGTQSSARTCW